MTKTSPQGSLRPCKWAFDDGKPYDGWTDDTYWNGFLNVCVTPETRDKLVADMLPPQFEGDQESADDLASLPIVDGKVWLENGWSISEHLSKIDELLAEFAALGLTEDRMEYSVDDLMDAGYDLTRTEAEELYARLQQSGDPKVTDEAAMHIELLATEALRIRDLEDGSEEAIDASNKFFDEFSKAGFNVSRYETMKESQSGMIIDALIRMRKARA